MKEGITNFDLAIRFLEEIGWEFLPVAPEEWQWLKSDGNRIIARQGDEFWEYDLALAKRARDEQR